MLCIRYDVGGYAWDNAELGTDLWLWMSFLRTGRADIFRIAHAMTRHLSEVDFHHIGPFAGLGSRHNVSHWGDGAKEARVSSSTLKRPFYYLTADEQMGDLMRYSLQADKTLIEWEPLRKILPKPTAPTRVRIGPDWTALAGNWFTEWEHGSICVLLMRNEADERYEMARPHCDGHDRYWSDEIWTIHGLYRRQELGMGVSAKRLTLAAHIAVGFDPDTAHLTDEGGQFQASYHLTMLFGGGEFLMELVDTLYAKLQAYAGQRLNDTNQKQLAWNQIIAATTFGDPVKVGGVNVIEPINEVSHRP
ncbi:hypothetical protein FRC07_008516 [Ceratobasidium sp. 392]|nr:hypothetical protein FRC07_008516 [Ceratobasidium sp. 392]